MKRSYLLNIFLFSSLLAKSVIATSLVRNFSIYGLNEDRQSIDNISFPRTNEVKYRGVTPIQMGRNKAIRAMLGDSNAHIESILFSAIKKLLMNTPVPFISSVNDIIINRDLIKHVNKAVSKNGNVYFSEKEANQKALTIIENSIKKHIWKRGFLNLYVNYRSTSLELWAREVIFSTVYLEVANIYSKDIAVIDDSKNPQMLDLNYWNKVNNGAWVFTVHPWVDKGEFITPIHIDSNKIVGFKQYANKWASHQIYQDLQRNLNYAYFKDNNKKEIFIFDGTSARGAEQAIVKKNGIFYYAQSRFNQYADVPDQLDVSSRKANLIGIIKLCPTTNSCALNNLAFSKYPKSTKTIPASVINSITSIAVNNYKAKIFYHNGTLDATEKITDLYSYKNNLSPKVYTKKLMNKDKKIKGEMVNVLAKVSKNKLVYDLADLKVDKKKAVYLILPKNIRNRAVSKVKLTQRQDISYESSGITSSSQWDRTPGYASIQFHSADPRVSDKWRYSSVSTRNPKGSLFAELSTVDKMKAQNINYWSAHKGHVYDLSSSDLLKFDSIRIINVGEDPIIIKTLEVKLK